MLEVINALSIHQLYELLHFT